MHPIYLHYLDSELTAAAGVQFSRSLIRDVTCTVLVCTMEQLYCGISLIWETGSDAELLKFIVALTRSGVLAPAGNFVTIEEFIESRYTLFSDHRDHFGVYFDADLARQLSTLCPSFMIRKDSPTTEHLKSNLENSSLEPEFLRTNANFNSLVDVRSITETINRGLEKIGSGPIYYGTFERFGATQSIPNGYFLRRIISEDYARQYLNIWDGDIITGIPHLHIFDYLSKSFPVLDYSVFRTITDHEFGDFWHVNLEAACSDCSLWRGSENHTRFVDALNLLIWTAYRYNGLDAINNRFAARPHLIHTIRSILRHSAGKQRQPKTPIELQLSFLEASCRIRSACEAIARNDPSFKSTLMNEEMRIQGLSGASRYGPETLGEMLLSATPFYSRSGVTLDETRRRVVFFKDYIENKGGYKLFYSPGGKREGGERRAHILFRAVWPGTGSDVSREVDDGRGPADYKISRGATDKTLVEFKLASNTRLRQNLLNQLQVYKKASDAQAGVTVIVYFSEQELSKVKRILKELGFEDDSNIFLVDARSDNKPSGSKA